MKNTYSEKNNIDTDTAARMSADDKDTVDHKVDLLDKDEEIDKDEETIPLGYNEDDEGDDISSHDLMELLSRLKTLAKDTDDEDDEDDEETVPLGYNEDDEDDEDDEDGEPTPDVDDYHNKAVTYARKSRYSKAVGVCMEGLEKFPRSVDLLADIIAYSKDAGDMERAGEYYHILRNQFPFRRWSWRAFTFSLKYLLAEDPEANEEECRLLIENYRKYLPYEEMADIAESELEKELGNEEKSMAVLRNALLVHTNASQCALLLADMLMDRGLYEDVISTTAYGIAASAVTQPAINVPYLYYLRTLSKDYLLHRKECRGEPITGEEVSALKEEYGLLRSEFPELLYYSRNINTRIKMLKFIKTE